MTTDMNNEMWDYLSQYGYVQSNEMTWVHPWVTYWQIVGVDRARGDSIIEHLKARYPDYRFGKGEAHIKNIIYETINICKK